MANTRDNYRDQHQKRSGLKETLFLAREGRMIRQIKRDIARGYHAFCLRRGLDPDEPSWADKISAAARAELAE